VKESQKSLEQALEDAVSRALRDNLAPLQRTADELHQAYADLVAACSSTRPSNALPAMLRAQTAASALAAGLSVLSNFVAVALNPRERTAAEQAASSFVPAVAVVEDTVEVTDVKEEPAQEAVLESPAVAEEPTEEAESISAHVEPPVDAAPVELPLEPPPAPAAPVTTEAALEEATHPMAVAEPPAFDIASLSPELQELHRRANRAAKVSIQDVQLLRPKDVQLGREHKDICNRLRNDLDKARKEYDRRFRAILDHPVDYFHHWMVEILAEGNSEALGEYPYPSPVLRH